MANNNPNTKHLAELIHNTLKDMDFFDYASTEEEDIQSLENDLALLQKHGNGALLQVIEMLTDKL